MRNKRITSTPFRHNDEVLIWCWREYGYPTLSDMQSYNISHWKGNTLQTLFTTQNIFILKSANSTATELNQHLVSCFLNPFFLTFCYCSSFGSDGNGVNNVPILHLCHSKACSWISTTLNEVICLRVARSPPRLVFISQSVVGKRKLPRDSHRI